MDVKTIEVEGRRTAYWESAGKGGPVVLVHGNSASKAVWEKQMTSGLAGRYRLLAPDFPGHGDSVPSKKGISIFCFHLGGLCFLPATH